MIPKITLCLWDISTADLKEICSFQQYFIYSDFKNNLTEHCSSEEKVGSLIIAVLSEI